jgi:RNA polymerase sigma-70 factor (ECF subfamily)
MLRGLAGHLVADPGAADDAVQEAWLAALQRRPDADRPLEPWLKRVVRNVTARFKRDRARRDRRERRAARPEAAPDAHALAERARLLRLLLDEVLTLPEAEREAVLLRYYEGLPPRAIAERLGAPVEIVYRRLEHALERLRGRLDARHGGQRASWCLGLVAALGIPRELFGPTTLATAGAVVTTSGTLAGGSLAGGTLAGGLIMGSAAATVSVSLLTLGLGVGAGWLAHGSLGSDVDEVGERAEGPSEGAGGIDAERTRGGLRLEASEASRREAQLQEEVRTLRAQVADLTNEKEALAKAQAQANAPLDPKALRFGLGGPTPNFDKADWADLSSHMTEMTKMMPKLREQLARGESPGAELGQAIGEHNMPLAMFAMATAGELNGSGPNGAYTHPAVLANLMRSALIAANDPLTAAQEQALVTLGNAWAADHERSLKSLPADAPALAATVLEVDSKSRFLESAKAQLTVSQRNVLFHPETEGRLGIDLLSPALVYMMHSDAGMPSAEALPAKVLASLLGSTGLKVEEQAAFLDIAARWIQDAPLGTTPVQQRDPDVMFPRVEVMQAFARAQVTATQRILDTGRLTAEQAAKLRKTAVVVTPYVVKGS